MQSSTERASELESVITVTVDNECSWFKEMNLKEMSVHLMRREREQAPVIKAPIAYYLPDWISTMFCGNSRSTTFWNKMVSGCHLVDKIFIKTYQMWWLLWTRSRQTQRLNQTVETSYTRAEWFAKARNFEVDTFERLILEIWQCHLYLISVKVSGIVIKHCHRSDTARFTIRRFLEYWNSKHFGLF